MRTALVFACLVGMACAFSVSAGQWGDPSGLAGAGVGCLPTQSFPQVKSWLQRAKSDDSEENGVGSPPTLRAQPHAVLALRMRTFQSLLYPSPQTMGFTPFFSW